MPTSRVLIIKNGSTVTVSFFCANFYMMNLGLFHRAKN